MNNGNGQAGVGGQGVSQVSQAAEVAQQQVTGAPTIESGDRHDGHWGDFTWYGGNGASDGGGKWSNGGWL